MIKLTFLWFVVFGLLCLCGYLVTLGRMGVAWLILMACFFVVGTALHHESALINKENNDEP